MTYIHCLNDSEETINLIISIVNDAESLKVKSLKIA